VAQEFELHPLAVEDALDAHQRPKLERYGGTFFVVLKPARYLDEVERVEFGEIRIFLGENFVITVRHSESPDVGMVRQSLEADPESSSGGGPRPSCTPSWTRSWTTTGPWWTASRTTSRR
jgi:magnesium transporter